VCRYNESQETYLNGNCLRHFRGTFWSDIFNLRLIKPFGLVLYVTIIAIRDKRVFFFGNIEVDAGARVGRRDSIPGAMTARIKRRG
jgi:hypothetical protein